MINSLILATGNPHKLAEIQSIFGDSLAIFSLKDLDCYEVLPEEQDTLEGNALQKALWVFQRFQKPCLADDTGLEVFALEGRPGVFSARYAGEENSAKQSEANITKLLREMKDIRNRQARFRTVLAFIDALGENFLYEGIVEGEIAEESRGEKGFGYDSVFIPRGFQQTFAEMPFAMKNSLSHRGRAIAAFVEGLQFLSEPGHGDI